MASKVLTVRDAVAECKRLHGFNRMDSSVEAWVKAAREEGMHVETENKDAHVPGEDPDLDHSYREVPAVCTGAIDMTTAFWMQANDY